MAAVCEWLAEKDQSLAVVAKDYKPPIKSKKRKLEDPGGESPKPKKKAANKGNKSEAAADPELTERKERAMQSLKSYVQENGGNIKLIKNFTCRVTRKPSDGRYDNNFYNEVGKRFRSMVEVGKFLKLSVTPARSAGGKKAAGMKKRKSTSTEVEAEKRKLRKELDKLRRQHTKARKQLDDFLTDEKDSKYPVEDVLLQKEENGAGSKILPTNCPAARLPEIDSFPSIPEHCMPEVLAVWDFLSTFSRNLNLNPISLEDFVQCLTYKPPSNLTDGDVFKAPPVFLGEAHLALLKLILSDGSSDEWWWSILETDVTENAVAAVVDTTGTDESTLPLIKVDFAALLLEPEDPLITQSWLQNLEKVRRINENEHDSIQGAIRSAMGVVANKWVRAYLRKSLKLGKTSGSSFMKRAVIWLVDRFREARPDLKSRSVNTKSVLEKRDMVVAEVTQQMGKLSAVALAVTDDDLASDIEDEESDDDSDSDDEDKESENRRQEATLTMREDADDRPASYIPKKPAPTLVDLLLPPGKPAPPTDLLNPPSWPEIAGATASRIIHRYRRLRNELDDSLRLIRELPRLTVRQRREREAIASKRVFSEFAESADDDDPPQKAIDHLCGGGDYLALSPLQRLCILRVLIDAAYDTSHIYEIIDTNHKQRTNAVKALNAEQRKASKEAKEKAAAAEAVAREDLANEAKQNFIEEKREEIRKFNETSESKMTDEEIDELTEEDILELDDDIRADFEALPSPESFKKAEVLARVEQINEATAFDTEVLTVLTMAGLLDKEKAELAELKQTFQELGGEEALMDPTLDRSVIRRIEKARRDVRKSEEKAEFLPIQRETAIDALKEAIADGTIKSLRSAIRIAKTAQLTGPDPFTNGVWALDAVRDAYMELENAKQLKRVADAQQDLVTKLARSFTRTEPLGSDRFRNRLWRFENSEQCHVWCEINPAIKEANAGLTNQDGFLPIVASASEVTIGAADIEEDFKPKDASKHEQFSSFSRKEYDSSGMSGALTKRHWGCHASESAVRALMKGLDGRGIRENELKKNLKDALEKATAAENSTTEDAKTNSIEDIEESKSNEDAEEEVKEKQAKYFKTSGDEDVFAAAKSAALATESNIINKDMVVFMSSAIGQRVRIQHVIEKSRDNLIARYEDSTITGWRIREDQVPVMSDDGDEFDPEMETVDTPIWHCTTNTGQEIWLTGHEVLEAICRFLRKKNQDVTYFESDASFLAYRNSLGRYCGKAAEAGLALTPLRFAQFMVQREAELYQRLKHLVYESTWGGRDGNRTAWSSSMKDYAFEFETAREGLLTLENGLLEMTGGLPAATSENEQSAKELLENPSTREDIELESLDKGAKGLWNSRASREVFLEIMKTCKTVGFLALGLELLTRNCLVYIDANSSTKNSLPSAPEFTPFDLGTAPRSSRRSGALSSWQDESSLYYDDIPASRSSRRAGRVNYAGLD